MHPVWAQNLSHWPPEKISHLDRYAALLREVNNSINLVSRKDVDNLEERHILYALAISEAGLLKNLNTLADIGTGGGLPGIPLAIAAPEVKVTLVDSIEKKVKTLSRILTELALPNVKVVRSRAEALEGTFDLITGRAVCPLPEFLKLVRHLLAQGSTVAYLTGSKNPAERRIRGWKILEIPVAEIFPKSEFLRDKFILHAQRTE